MTCQSNGRTYNTECLCVNGNTFWWGFIFLFVSLFRSLRYLYTFQSELFCKFYECHIFRIHCVCVMCNGKLFMLFVEVEFFVLFAPYPWLANCEIVYIFVIWHSEVKYVNIPRPWWWWSPIICFMETTPWIPFHSEYMVAFFVPSSWQSFDYFFFSFSTSFFRFTISALYFSGTVIHIFFADRCVVKRTSLFV